LEEQIDNKELSFSAALNFDDEDDTEKIMMQFLTIIYKKASQSLKSDIMQIKFELEEIVSVWLKKSISECG